jgi:TolB protein
VDGSDIKQLTPSVAGVRSYRTSPDWSPDGRTIAFEQQNGDFQVWTIGLDDRKMRKLTSIGENEDPSWAPDAQHIVLTSTRHGSKNLWVLDSRTGRMRQLTFNDGARLAAWSPLLSTNTVVTASAAPVSTGGNQ